MLSRLIAVITVIALFVISGASQAQLGSFQVTPYTYTITGSTVNFGVTSPINESGNGYPSSAQAIPNTYCASVQKNVTVKWRVRYYPVTGETLGTVSAYAGMLNYNLSVYAFQYSQTNPSHASACPDQDSGISVSITSAATYPQNGYATKSQSKATPVTVSLSTSTDESGRACMQGYYESKAVMAVGSPTTSYGFANAYATMSLGQAKSVMVIRPENAEAATWDDGSSLGGYIERDRYNSDGTAGSGNTRFNINTNILGHYIGDITWQARLNGNPWPPYDDWFPAVVDRWWHWYAEYTAPITPQNALSDSTYHIQPFDTVRCNTSWPYVSNGMDPRTNIFILTGIPDPVEERINLHVIDADITGQHQEWNFGGSDSGYANFWITFHHEIEDAIPYGAAFRIPPSDIPWVAAKDNNGNYCFMMGLNNAWSGQYVMGDSANWGISFNPPWISIYRE